MLKLSSTLSLPPQAVTRKFAFVGMSGSGKTYSAGKFVEELYGAGAQVVVVDVIGNWWGLRLAADGKKAGLPIYVFGGLQGDVPLEPTGGRLVADTVVDTHCSVVLDISDMTAPEQRRFVTEFATRLLQRKKRARSPIQIVWEECQDVVPEYAPGEVARCVGAVSKLAKQGRNFGVGSTFITQRPQAVAKEVLNQVECLFTFSTSGTQELDALRAWMKHKSVPAGALDELKDFEEGQGFVWSPAWLKRFDRVKFLKKATYDASATPDFGSDESSKKPAPLDLKKISTAMAETIERAKENDPGALRAEVARLKALIAKQAAPRVETMVERTLTKEDLAEIASLRECTSSLETAFADLVAQFEKLNARFVPEIAKLAVAAAGFGKVKNGSASASLLGRRSGPPTLLDSGLAERHAFRPAPESGGQRSRVPDGERAILTALIQYPEGLHRHQLTVLAGYKRSTRDAYIQRLRAKGYVEVCEDRVIATSEGRAALPDAEPLPRGEALQERWLSKLPDGEATLLRQLIDAYPDHVARAQLHGYKTSTRDAYLQRLRAKQLVVDVGRGQVKASETLFN